MRTPEDKKRDDLRRDGIVFFWSGRIDEIVEMGLVSNDGENGGRSVVLKTLVDNLQEKVRDTTRSYMNHGVPTSGPRPTRGELEGIVTAYDMARTVYLNHKALNEVTEEVAT